MDQRENGKINISSIFRILAISLVALFLAVFIFFAFRTRILANQALRDAKNVYLALSTAEIEFYSQGKSIYDPTKYNGLSEGVAERVTQLVDNEGIYRIISYDARNHRVTEMIYYNGNYYVFFVLDGNTTTWEVKYLMPIYRYKD